MKGMTILEMVMVLVMMALVGSMVVPKVIKLRSAWDLEKTARTIAMTIKRAQQQAKSKQVDYGVRFDLTNNCYDYGYDGGSFVVLETGCLPAGIDIFNATPPGYVYFDHLGAPTQGFDVYLHDLQCDDWMTVKINRVTGRVLVQQM